MQNREWARDLARPYMRYADSMMLGIHHWGALPGYVMRWMEQRLGEIYVDLDLLPPIQAEVYNFGGVHGVDWYGEAPQAIPKEEGVYSRSTPSPEMPPTPPATAAGSNNEAGPSECQSSPSLVKREKGKKYARGGNADDVNIAN